MATVVMINRPIQDFCVLGMTTFTSHPVAGVVPALVILQATRLLYTLAKFFHEMTGKSVDIWRIAARRTIVILKED